MSDEQAPSHPQEFRALCEQAIERFRALAAAPALERGALIPDLRALLQRIDAEMDELDLLQPRFAEEQGLLVNAASALQSIDLDRGGPHVARYVERAVADLRRVAG